jgi:8-oxo-dGTP diphosphatase
MQDVVLFIFYNPDTKKVLSEQRPPDHPDFPNQTTFPTGKVEDGESIEEAMYREAKEEFGIVPKVFIKLPNVIGNSILHPFWVKEWEGELPEVVLDKGSKLIWESLEEAAASPIKTRKILVTLLRKEI